MEAFYAEIRLFSYPDAPEGWLPCDGQVLQIREHTALFSLLGTTFGGDGNTTFALPDLRGRIPMHLSDRFALGALAPARVPEFDGEAQPYQALAYFISITGIYPPRQ